MHSKIVQTSTSTGTLPSEIFIDSHGDPVKLRDGFHCTIRSLRQENITNRNRKALEDDRGLPSCQVSRPNLNMEHLESGQKLYMCSDFALFECVHYKLRRAEKVGLLETHDILV